MSLVCYSKDLHTLYVNPWIHHVLQEKVLNFICDSYYDQTGSLTVPESLGMKKDISDRRQILELKGYRTKNRYKIWELDNTCFLVHLKLLNAHRFFVCEGVLWAEMIVPAFWIG